MRVLGVDPGSAVTGFGVVEGRPGDFRFIAAGVIRTSSIERAPNRLKRIHEQLLAAIDAYRPDAVSLERSFVAANVQSAFRLGEARAMAMLAAAERGLPLEEYPPNQVKLAVAAFGHADKSQVKYMVRRTLGLAADYELPDDAADALAIAICHLGRARAPRLVDAVERPALPARLRRR
ncbi:MAG TPA: crossover junction endodeoxyribonuclease RuvC [Candidatus Binataceae bacterium]|nr:crossover junction endodeoxyribonuclease RuvC [Candidatus Binataceae bacterium]